MRCERCCGRKKLFKINSIFSLTNTGGAEVTCPMCSGTGQAEPKVAEKEYPGHQDDSEEKTGKKVKKI